MTITKQRRLRHAIRIVRLESLAEIDRLEKHRCEKCRGRLGSKASIKEFRCDCDAAVSIRELANLL